MPKLVHGILPALCTPFDDQLKLATDRVPVLIRSLLDAGSNGFFICGGTGEGRTMSVAERRDMCEAATRSVARQVPVIFHVGGTTTEDAVALSRMAASLGADAVASVAPVDQPNNLDAAVRHYAAIGAAGDLPFYVYWLAKDADQGVTPVRFLEAMKQVPNFAGVKFTDPNFFLFQQLIDLSKGQINAITGPDEMCVAGMAMGSDGAIGTTYNIMPKLFIKMRRDFYAGRVREATEAQVNANKVIALLITVGVLAGVKAMLGWRGTPVGPPRPPLVPLTTENEQRLRDGLATFNFEVA